MADYGAGYARGRAQGLMAAAGRKRQATARREQVMMAERARRDQLNIARKDLEIRVRDAQRRDFKESERRRIDAGLGQALQQGGYSAGIEYLKAEDPRQAIAFHSEKLKLDGQILQNDRLKNLGDLEKQKALFEAYGQGGKIAAGIQQMREPEERARAYKMMLPMLDKIAPGMPRKYNMQADTALKLMMAQGTPENILYAMEKVERKAQSTIGKLHNDLRVAKTRGDESEVNSLTKKLLGEQQKNEAAIMQGTLTQLQQTKNEQQIRSLVQKDLDRLSKPFNEQMEAFTPVIDTLKVLDEDPGNSTARARLRYAVARMAERAGPLTESDLKGTAGRAGYKSVSLAVESWFRGKNIALTDMEMKQVQDMLRVYMDQTVERQVQRETLFDRTVGYDTSNLIKPSDVYKQSWQIAPGGADQNLGQEYSQEDLEFTAQKHGMTVDEVRAALQGQQ